MLYLLVVFIDADLAKNWPTAKGAFIKTDLKTVGPARTTGSCYVKFYPDFLYSYSVNGVEYKSSAIYKSDLSKFDFITKTFISLAGYDERTLKLLRKEYIMGKTPIVYYDPKDPSRAILKPGNGASKG